MSMPQAKWIESPVYVIDDGTGYRYILCRACPREWVLGPLGYLSNEVIGRRFTDAYSHRCATL